MKLNEELDSFYITKDKRKKILLITDDLGEVVMEFANYVDSQSSKMNW